jgi:peroxiredoxin
MLQISMNKKVFRYSLYTLVALAFATLVVSIVYKKQNQKAPISTLPTTPLYSLDSTLFNLQAIENQNIVLIYFNSGCEHCQYEAKTFAENLPLFQSIKVVWFSVENINEVKKFATTYHLLQQPNHIFLKANQQDLSREFNNLSPPSIWIYKNKTIIKHFKGETKIETLLKYL